MQLLSQRSSVLFGFVCGVVATSGCKTSEETTPLVASGGAVAATAGGGGVAAGGTTPTSATGGNPSTTAGSATSIGGAVATGGANAGGSSSGGATAKGGTPATGGSSSGGNSSGGATAVGGATAGTTSTVGPGTYALNPPNQCTNKFHMGAGGLGANNGCFSINGSSSPAGLYQYIGYPAAGQPGDGGVKPVGNWGNNTACKNHLNWVTEATIGSAECVAKVTTACNEIKATDANQQAAAIRSCIQSNDAKSDYHLNWYFWVKRVECPTHLTEVTGCKLASQGLPAADRNVTTVAQAQAAGFRQKDGNGQKYFTTTMEDCCMPTCAWSDNVKIATKDGYSSFYSCDQGGIPRTE